MTRGKRWRGRVRSPSTQCSYLEQSMQMETFSKRWVSVPAPALVLTIIYHFDPEWPCSENSGSSSILSFTSTSCFLEVSSLLLFLNLRFLLLLSHFFNVTGGQETHDQLFRSLSEVRSCSTYFLPLLSSQSAVLSAPSLSLFIKTSHHLLILPYTTFHTTSYITSPHHLLTPLPPHTETRPSAAKNRWTLRYATNCAAW